MAKGSISMTCSKAWKGSIEWESTPNENGNYSIVSAKCYTWKTDGFASSGGSSFEGQLKVGSRTVDISFLQAEVSKTLVASLSGVVVNHNSNGVGSVAISAYITKSHGTSLAGITLEGSENVNLGTIDVAGPSVMTLGADSVQMGKKLLISINRDDSECTHTLSFSFCGTKKTIATDVEGSYAWTVPDLAGSCVDAVSGECTLTCKTYRNGKYLGYTQETVTLTVQDPTVPSVEGGEVTIGQEYSVSCVRNSENFTLKLEFIFKELTVTIADGGIDSASWKPRYYYAKEIPSLTYGTGTLKCTTMNGSAVVGTETQTIRVHVPNNSTTKPVFTLDGLKLTPVSDLSDTFSGLYIQGKTGLKAEFTATSEYSEIANYSISIGAAKASGNPAIIDQLASDGEVKVTAKVTDARGYSTTVSTTISILPYHKPRVIPYTGYSEVICERALDTGELNPNGTYLAIRAGKSYSSIVVDGQELNRCYLRYRWKITGAASFSEWVTILSTTSAKAERSMLISDVVNSLQTSYVVELIAADSLGGRHMIAFQIMTAAISFVLYDGVDGAGFGKYPEAPHVVDIAAHMTLMVRGKLLKTGYSWINLGLAESISESSYNLGRNSSGCYYRLSEENHVIIAFNCAFSYTGTELVINSTVIPEEYRPPHKVFAMCPGTNRRVILVSVDTDGYIRVEWVQQLSDTVLTGSSEITWTDAYIDYWT